MITSEMEEFAVFCVCVAGKTADHASKAVKRLLAGCQGSPFGKIMRLHSSGRLPAALRAARTGNYGKLSKALPALAGSGLDLGRCSVPDLESLYGIGPKTARYFVLHTRPGAKVAALDVHALRHLRSLGYDAPRSTPSSRRRYAELEKAFLHEAERQGLSPVEFDLRVWTRYSKSALPSYHGAEAEKMGIRC